MRPPVFGWLIVLGWTLAILLAFRSSLDSAKARRVIAEVRAVMDTLAAKQCIVVSPGSDVRVFPPRADTLKRARP